MLTALDPNDPQPPRSAFGDDYKSFRKADQAWNKRERKRRKLAAAQSEAAALPAPAGPTGAGAGLTEAGVGDLAGIGLVVAGGAATEQAGLS